MCNWISLWFCSLWICLWISLWISLWICFSTEFYDFLIEYCVECSFKLVAYINGSLSSFNYIINDNSNSYFSCVVIKFVFYGINFCSFSFPIFMFYSSFDFCYCTSSRSCVYIGKFTFGFYSSGSFDFNCSFGFNFCYSCCSFGFYCSSYCSSRYYIVSVFSIFVSISYSFKWGIGFVYSLMCGKWSVVFEVIVIYLIGFVCGFDFGFLVVWDGVVYCDFKCCFGCVILSCDWISFSFCGFIIPILK